MIKHTLCYPTDPRVTYSNWTPYKKSIILPALKLSILLISEISECLTLDASGIDKNKFVFYYA